MTNSEADNLIASLPKPGGLRLFREDDRIVMDRRQVGRAYAERQGLERRAPAHALEGLRREPGTDARTRLHVTQAERARRTSALRPLTISTPRASSSAASSSASSARSRRWTTT
jgi:hypothetical protein